MTIDHWFIQHGYPLWINPWLSIFLFNMWPTTVANSFVWIRSPVESPTSTNNRRNSEAKSPMFRCSNVSKVVCIGSLCCHRRMLNAYLVASGSWGHATLDLKSPDLFCLNQDASRHKAAKYLMSLLQILQVFRSLIGHHCPQPNVKTLNHDMGWPNPFRSCDMDRRTGVVKLNCQLRSWQTPQMWIAADNKMDSSEIESWSVTLFRDSHVVSAMCWRFACQTVASLKSGSTVDAAEISAGSVRGNKDQGAMWKSAASAGTVYVFCPREKVQNVIATFFRLKTVSFSWIRKPKQSSSRWYEGPFGKKSVRSCCNEVLLLEAGRIRHGTGGCKPWWSGSALEESRLSWWFPQILGLRFLMSWFLILLLAKVTIFGDGWRGTPDTPTVCWCCLQDFFRGSTEQKVQPHHLQLPLETGLPSVTVPRVSTREMLCKTKVLSLCRELSYNEVRQRNRWCHQRIFCFRVASVLLLKALMNSVESVKIASCIGQTMQRFDCMALHRNPLFLAFEEAPIAFLYNLFFLFPFFPFFPFLSLSP